MPTEQNYDIVLKDLEARHRRYSEEIARLSEEQKMVTQTLSNLRHFCVSPQETLPFAEIVPAPREIISSPGRGIVKDTYSRLSIRRAILYLLAGNAHGATLRRAEIAKSLTDGGMTSNAKSFASNVSAVLSVMVKERQEVEKMENKGYRITAHGREVWEASIDLGH